mgnify:CR=1 FL=1
MYSSSAFSSTLNMQVGMSSWRGSPQLAEQLNTRPHWVVNSCRAVMVPLTATRGASNLTTPAAITLARLIPIEVVADMSKCVTDTWIHDCEPSISRSGVAHMPHNQASHTRTSMRLLLREKVSA